jgi:uncharacterized protein (DUF58 family)
MTRTGRLALALGLATYVAAWAFGSKPLYPVATGLLLAVALAWAWVRLAKKPMRLVRTVGELDYVEGDDVKIDLDLELEGRVAPASLTVVERIGKLGERRTSLHRGGANYHTRYVLPSLPRGRYAYEGAHAELEDPFGLERTEVQLGGAGGALLVYPRLVELDRVFSESGAHSPDGRRLLLRRPSGFELHSVREYEQGESLRKVHWRSTARRGQLMVKELEDAPRDEVAVVLDADAASVRGTPPDSTFDVQVRAAGSILGSHVRRGRRAALVVNGAVPESRRVHASEGDWRRALELLAAAEPARTAPVAGLLRADESPAARALDVVVVTARLAPELVDRLTQRVLGRRRASLVYVDPSSFASAPALAAASRPLLLRLQSVGVPVAIVRRGDDLAERLGGAPAARAAHG